MCNFRILGMITLAAVFVGCAPHGSLRHADLERTVARLGHRNWVVVADSAYPLQSHPGITTVLSGQGQLETVRQVMQILNQSGHVRGKIHLDRELQYVPESDAPGIEAYRTALSQILRDADVREILHEELIGKLDEAAGTFQVYLIKTDLTLPYTSVFFELDCGYWSGAAEANLRRLMSQSFE